MVNLADTNRNGTVDGTASEWAIDNSFASWSCPAYVPVSQLIYAAFRSKAKGLLPPSDE
jgi:hypothetical protein